MRSKARGSVPWLAERNALFTPPELPPYYEQRVIYGLTLDEAERALKIRATIIEEEEAYSEPDCLPAFATVCMLYHDYLIHESESRHRNVLIFDFEKPVALTLRTIRESIFSFGYAKMGSLYGLSADEWCEFELHEKLLTRSDLKLLENDVLNYLLASDD